MKDRDEASSSSVRFKTLTRALPAVPHPVAFDRVLSRVLIYDKPLLFSFDDNVE